MTATAIEKVVSWLKPGGVAVLDIRLKEGPHIFGDARRIDANEIKTLLMQNGIKSFSLRRGVLQFQKPFRKLSG